MSNVGIIASSRLMAGAAIVVAISDLAATDKEETTITLGWTTPVGSTNPIDYYKVYLDGVFHENTTDDTPSWITTGLTSGTSYDITLITVDTLGNESVASNLVVETTK